MKFAFVILCVILSYDFQVESRLQGMHPAREILSVSQSRDVNYDFIFLTNNSTQLWVGNVNGAPEYIGVITLLLFIGILLWTSVYALMRRWVIARSRMSGMAAGAFRYAASQGNIAVMKEISRMDNFDINADLAGFSALHAAVVQGQIAAVEWLLLHGASVSGHKNEKWKDTTLHYAAANGHVEVSRLLLQYGANPKLKNFANFTPADVAMAAGFKDLSSALQKLCEQPDKPKASLPKATSLPLAPSSMSSEASVVESFPNTFHSATPPIRSQQVLPISQGQGPDLEMSSGSGSAERKVQVTDSISVSEYISKGFNGLGTHGTYLKEGTYTLRVVAIVSLKFAAMYFVWRATRSLSQAHIVYDVVFFACEMTPFLACLLFCLELWTPLQRQPRSLLSMCPSPSHFPTVDVFVLCCNEPVAIVQATVCAALNMTYPAWKLQVMVLDDGPSSEVEAMCQRLHKEMASKKSGPYGRGWASLSYRARTKMDGVPHHAKAGNINSQLLKGKTQGSRQGSFVVVFDCDMIPKPEFLDKVMGHFFEPAKDGKTWQPCPRLAFVQTPQDFYNVDLEDTMGHRSAFFYGPMMQGRDGMSACPCVGTGVVFRRDALVSIGGQAVGSVTEDYNTTINLMASGFSSVYLNERLIYGLAPEDLESVYTQKLRWAMGSLQILFRGNPLFNPDLSIPQALLFFESAFQHFLSIPTLVVIMAPIIFMWTGIGPLGARVDELCLFFSLYYVSNRVLLWSAHRGVPNPGLELWRWSQAWVWTSPISLHACWNVFLAESSFLRWIRLSLPSNEIAFSVTKKSMSDGSEHGGWVKDLRLTWPYWSYYLLLFGGVVVVVVKLVGGVLTLDDLVAQVVALSWGILVCMYFWPPLTLAISWLKPAPGGKVQWNERPAALADAFHRHQGPAAEVEKQLQLDAMEASNKGPWWIPSWLRREREASTSVKIVLSDSATLQSRPEFTLKRRVKDSSMFVLLNAVMLAALLSGGLYYSLHRP